MEETNTKKRKYAFVSEKKAEASRRNGRLGGCPKMYDPLEIARQMLEWSKLEDSINIVGFCADRGYVPNLIWRMDKENEEFAEAYMITKMRLAERRERLMNADLLNYGSWNRYQRYYDPFLAKDEDDKEDKDAARKRGVVENEQANLILLAKLAAGGEIAQKD